MLIYCYEEVLFFLDYYDSVLCIIYSEERLVPEVKSPNFFTAAFRLPELERSIFLLPLLLLLFYNCFIFLVNFLVMVDQ